MKKLLLHLSGRQILGAALLLFFMASCSPSPYRYVKVDPKEAIKKVEKSNPEEPADVVASVPITPADDTRPVAANSADQSFSSPAIENNAAPTAKTQNNGQVTVVSNVPVVAKENKTEPLNTRQVVSNELSKTAEFKSLSQKKQDRLVNRITKKVDRVKAKANGSANSIVFNQWMKIGVILLLVGLVVGLLWGALGWVVSVIGLVFLILGLIQQM